MIVYEKLTCLSRKRAHDQQVKTRYSNHLVMTPDKAYVYVNSFSNIRDKSNVNWISVQFHVNLILVIINLLKSNRILWRRKRPILKAIKSIQSRTWLSMAAVISLLKAFCWLSRSKKKLSLSRISIYLQKAGLICSTLRFQLFVSCYFNISYSPLEILLVSQKEARQRS